MPPDTVTKPDAKAKNAPPPQVFRVGVYETDTPDIDTTLVSSAAVQKLGTFKISPNGWLAGIWCLFEGSGFTTGTYTLDTPWSGINKVTFRDVGNPDPRNPASGFVAAATNFTFLLYIPLELVYRDSLGEIENKSSSSSYTLEIFIDTNANAVTGITGNVTWRLRANLVGYTEPETADSYGRPLAQSPPAAGTVQYWTEEIYNAASGAARYNQVNGIGYPIRNLIYLAYDNANGTRASGWNFSTQAGAFPDPLTLAVGKVQLFQRPVKMWQNLMAKWFALTAAGPDTALAPENGTFVQAFNREFDGIAGNELRNGLLVTKAGNVLQLAGTTAAAVNIRVLTNYVVPPGNDAARIRAR